MTQRKEQILSDLSKVQPAEAIAETPTSDRWLVIPYEAEGFSGKMLWSPWRSQPPEVTLPLPDLGLCRIHVGIYGCAETPTWTQQNPRKQTRYHWNRLELRLSDEDWFDFILPERFALPAYSYFSESYWKTANVSGKSLIFAPCSRKEACLDYTTLVTYVRLVPVDYDDTWPRETKRLVNYYDGNFNGHFCQDVSDIKTQIAPLAQSDCDTIFWTTCREDTCLYPTQVGHVLPDHGTPGVYPHWMGRDLHRMLRRGEDPLKLACDVAHACGLKIFASQRRQTCRVAPHVFPLHPEALLVGRPDLRCVDSTGASVPHLSLAYPEVRQMALDLFGEQTRKYDLDGVHLFWGRGVPLVLYEPPVIEAFVREFREDPRNLPKDDPRIYKTRGKVVLTFLRGLRKKLREVETAKNKKLRMAITVMNNPRVCDYFGMDIQTMVKEELVDLLIPFPCHYLPEFLGEWRCTPEAVAEFAAITKGTSVRLIPDCGYDYSEGKVLVEHRAAAFYDAGADGLQIMQGSVRGFGNKLEDHVHRRLGHRDELGGLNLLRSQIARAITIKTIAGLPLDRYQGIVTCG